MMENLFDSLCSCLMLSSNRERFLKGEGLQLMNLMLRYASHLLSCPSCTSFFVQLLTVSLDSRTCSQLWSFIPLSFLDVLNSSLQVSVWSFLKLVWMNTEYILVCLYPIVMSFGNRTTPVKGNLLLLFLLIVCWFGEIQSLTSKHTL